MFDYTPHPDCCNSRQGRCCDSDPKCTACNSSNCSTDDGLVPNFTNQCKLPNPCGKADVMQSMWRSDIQDQLCECINASLFNSILIVRFLTCTVHESWYFRW